MIWEICIHYYSFAKSRDVPYCFSLNLLAVIFYVNLLVSIVKISLLVEWVDLFICQILSPSNVLWSLML